MIRYFNPLSIANLLSVVHSSDDVRSAAGTVLKQCSHWVQKSSSSTWRINPRVYFRIPASSPSALTRANTPSCIVPFCKPRLPLLKNLMNSGSSADGTCVGVSSGLTHGSPLLVLKAARQHGKMNPKPISQSKPTPIEPVLLAEGSADKS